MATVTITITDEDILHGTCSFGLSYDQSESEMTKVPASLSWGQFIYESLHTVDFYAQMLTYTNRQLEEAAGEVLNDDITAAA